MVALVGALLANMLATVISKFGLAPVRARNSLLRSPKANFRESIRRARPFPPRFSNSNYANLNSDDFSVVVAPPSRRLCR